MSNNHLHEMLEASLVATSPLAEIERDSLATLFQRINDCLALGTPHAISDGMLDELITSYRAMRFKFLAEQDRKASEPRATRRKKTPPVLTALDALDDLEP